VDNTFNLPPSYALELCREIAARGRTIAWRAIVYPYQVSDELVAAMAEAGCAEVSIGSESCCDPILGSLNKRFSAAEVSEVVRRFARAGITRYGFLMLGVPGETRATVAESLEAADALRALGAQDHHRCRIYPFTPLAAAGRRRGRGRRLTTTCCGRASTWRRQVAGWVEEAVRSRSGRRRCGCENVEPVGAKSRCRATRGKGERSMLMKDRVALVTGASRGIGAATAKLLATHGPGSR
jgi:hypothetical protein